MTNKNLMILANRYSNHKDRYKEDVGRANRFAEELAKKGYNVHLTYGDYKTGLTKNQIIRNKVKINCYKITPNLFSFKKKIIREVKKKDIEFLLVTNGPLFGILGYMIKKEIPKIKLIYDIMDNYDIYAISKFPFIKKLNKLIQKKSNLNIYVTKILKNYYRGDQLGKSIILPAGINPQLFKPLNQMECRKKYNLPINKKIIVFTGSLDKRAMKRILEISKKLERNKEFLIVIAGYIKIKSKIKRKNILYLGIMPQNNIPEIINTSDIAIIPNNLDSFSKSCAPLKLIEYMGCNARILTTSCGDSKDIIRDNSAIVEDNTDKFIYKIKKNINLGKTSYRKQAKKFTWENLITNLIKELEKL
jgi:glycosyltransferase involved in cell wall biosynthesis